MRLLHIIVYAIVLFTIVGAVASVVAANASAATQVNPCVSALTWQQAATKVGSTVSVKGLVTSAHFATWKSGKGSMTFLDLGAKYPSPARLSIVVWNRNVAQYANKRVCARGLITVYQGVPEMSVDNVSSLTLAR